ncbi:hypothetical protein C5167_042859 [Papaver somniferum]|uniref:Uncharacterized protein n=1 Tax=Papaver somniferum TaxID=3469 RepID=A0A4Y7L7M5_PAPSO|nr:hypothetical protein C5167_042859 [Papaver somniferum]
MEAASEAACNKHIQCSKKKIDLGFKIRTGIMVHATYYGIGNDNLGNKDGADVEDNDIGIGNTSTVYKIGGSGYNEMMFMLRK